MRRIAPFLFVVAALMAFSGRYASAQCTDGVTVIGHVAGITQVTHDGVHDEDLVMLSTAGGLLQLECYAPALASCDALVIGWRVTATATVVPACVSGQYAVVELYIITIARTP